MAKSPKKEFVNPFRENGSYWALVQSLRKLGVGKMWAAEKLVETYKSVVGPSAWKAFKAKDARNEKTHKSAEDRVLVNATVIMRRDYGAPLRAVGFEVRKERDEKGLRFGLFPLKGKASKVARKAKKNREAQSGSEVRGGSEA